MSQRTLIHLPELRVDSELLNFSGRGEVEPMSAVAKAERLRYPGTQHTHHILLHIHLLISRN